MLGPPVAPVEVAAQRDRPDSEMVPAAGPAQHSCPHPFRRAHLEMLESPAVLVEVAAHEGQPAAELVPEEGPDHQSCPQPEAGCTTVGEAEESPNNSLIDGRYSAPSTLLPSGLG